MNLFGKKSSKKTDFQVDDSDEEKDSKFIRSLQINLSRLIAYAESAEVSLQREVAEKLANEAVKPARQEQIVQYGGLKLLIPLTKSVDEEVQRLAAHALANLSVNADNQRLMADEGAIECLITLLDSRNELIQRQAAKSLANLGVHGDNKQRVADCGGIPKLVRLAGSKSIAVRIEAIAALANLAVNDHNEVLIVREGGLGPIVDGLALAAEHLSGGYAREDRDTAQIEELATQCARATRNLSVNVSNKGAIGMLGANKQLEILALHSNDRISQQAKRALRNLDISAK